MERCSRVALFGQPNLDNVATRSSGEEAVMTPGEDIALLREIRDLLRQREGSH